MNSEFWAVFLSDYWLCLFLYVHAIVNSYALVAMCGDQRCDGWVFLRRTERWSAAGSHPVAAATAQTFYAKCLAPDCHAHYAGKSVKIARNSLGRHIRKEHLMDLPQHKARYGDQPDQQTLRQLYEQQQSTSTARTPSTQDGNDDNGHDNNQGDWVFRDDSGFGDSRHYDNGSLLSDDMAVAADTQAPDDRQHHQSQQQHLHSHSSLPISSLSTSTPLPPPSSIPQPDQQAPPTRQLYTLTKAFSKKNPAGDLVREFFEDPLRGWAILRNVCVQRASSLPQKKTIVNYFQAVRRCLLLLVDENPPERFDAASGWLERFPEQFLRSLGDICEKKHWMEKLASVPHATQHMFAMVMGKMCQVSRCDVKSLIVIIFLNINIDFCL